MLCLESQIIHGNPDNTDTMAHPCCLRINRVTVPVKMIGQNILRYYFGYSSGVTKNLGHSHLIPSLKLSARRCIHVAIVCELHFCQFFLVPTP